MAFPRNSLRSFLQYAKRNLAEATQGKLRVNIVIGNESADLDSLTTSLLYAYIRSIAPPRNAFSPLYIPLVNIPSSGLRLRPEFTAVCRHSNIPISSLITLDDFPIEPGPLENIHWILVDHNKLQGDLGHNFSSQVYGVIDHHDEENAIRQDTDPEPRIVEKCGSSTSLVVRYCKYSWDYISSSSLSSGAAHAQGEAAINDSAVTKGWDAQIAKMALASILIDTANLEAPGKVEKVDIEAVEYLEAKIQLSSKGGKSWSRDLYYQEIQEAKRDIDALTLREMLMKDYKQWTENGSNLGVSSVVKPLDFLVKKASADQNESNFEDGMMRFMSERSLSIFAIMTTSTSAEGQFQKELLLQSKTPLVSSAKNFAERAIPAFQLEDLEVENIHAQDEPDPYRVWRRIWQQKDLSKSRKQVAPLLREAMRG